MGIKIKTKQEIELMHKSGQLLAKVKELVWDAIKPGVSTQELQDIAEKEMDRMNVKPNFKGYHGFPAVLCASINEEMIHGIPNPNKIIKDGDVVKIDMGLIYKGWHSDSAFTKIVGEVSKKDKQLAQVAKDAFYVGVDAIKPGARIGDVGYAIGKFVKSKGFFVPQQFTGHGIGKALHEDPSVPNYGNKGTGPLIKEGMVIAIEPMILQNSNEVKVLSDNWTVVSHDGTNTSHYEHTVAIVDGKPVILTEGRI